MITVKRELRNLTKAIGIVLVSSAVGLGLLLLVFMIPTEKMHKNFARSASLIASEGTYPTFLGDVFVRMHPDNITDIKTLLLNNRITTRDNYTDALMLLNAFYTAEDKSLLERTLMVYRPCGDIAQDPILDIVNVGIKNVDTSNYIICEYARYWHGYLVFLKPLLCILSCVELRIINVFVLSGLLAAIMMELAGQFGKKATWGFAFSMLFFMPFTVPFCMQFCTSTYVMLGGMLILLKHKKYWIENERIVFLFLVLGIITSYVDYLTYPIVTFGMPMLVYLCLKPDCKLSAYIRSGVYWCIGYVGMWAMKWVYSSMFLQEDFIGQAISQILFRASNKTEDGLGRISVVSVIASNLCNYVNVVYIVLTLLAALFVIFGFRRMNFIERVRTKYLYIITSLLPFVWYIAFSNHSYGHSSFTFRALLVSAWGVMLFSGYDAGIQKNSENQGSITIEKRLSNG